MWHLIKTEFHYSNKNIVLVLGLLIPGAFVLMRASPIWQHDIYDEMMFLGLILFGFSVYFILHDLYASYSRRAQKVETDLIIMIVLVVAIILGIPLSLASIWENNGDILRMLCFALGLAFLYPAIVAFERRRSYLE